MILCRACGKLNPEGFNHCLECGSELSRRPPWMEDASTVSDSVLGRDPSTSAEELMEDDALLIDEADFDALTEIEATAASGGALDLDPSVSGSVRVASLPPTGMAGSTAATPLPASGAMGSGGDLDAFMARQSIKGVAPAAAPRACFSCGHPLGAAERFCPECGARQDAAPPPSAIEQARTVLLHPGADGISKASRPVGRLVTLDPAGREGPSFPLETLTVVGRSDGHIQFADDRLLSPRHCLFQYADGVLTVADEDSLNGVFVRLLGERELMSGDVFRVGQQLLMFRALADCPQVSGLVIDPDDDTRIQGSPDKGFWGALTRLSNRGIQADQFPLNDNPVLIGRERGHLTFPTDAFVSGTHARLRHEDGERFYLSDLNSSNGTYIRIGGEARIAHRDIVLLGQKLFRVELTG